MKTNNSLDLISDINAQVSKLKKKSHRGGALKKLEMLQNIDYKFLNKTEKNILKLQLNKLIGGAKTNSVVRKISFNIFDKKSIKVKSPRKNQHGGKRKLLVKKTKDVNTNGALSYELENIIGGAKEYEVNKDIQAILNMASDVNLIDTQYIDNMVGGSMKADSWIKRKTATETGPNEIKTGATTGVDELRSHYESADAVADSDSEVQNLTDVMGAAGAAMVADEGHSGDSSATGVDEKKCLGPGPCDCATCKAGDERLGCHMCDSDSESSASPAAVLPVELSSVEDKIIAKTDVTGAAGAVLGAVEGLSKDAGTAGLLDIEGKLKAKTDVTGAAGAVLGAVEGLSKEVEAADLADSAAAKDIRRKNKRERLDKLKESATLLAASDASAGAGSVAAQSEVVAVIPMSGSGDIIIDAQLIDADKYPKNEDDFVEHLRQLQADLESKHATATTTSKKMTYAETLVVHNKLSIDLYIALQRFFSRLEGGDTISNESVKKNVLYMISEILCSLDPDWTSADVYKFETIPSLEDNTKYKLFVGETEWSDSAEGGGVTTKSIRDWLLMLQGKSTETSTSPNKINTYIEIDGAKKKLSDILNSNNSIGEGAGAAAAEEQVVEQPAVEESVAEEAAVKESAVKESVAEEAVAEAAVEEAAEEGGAETEGEE